MKAQVENRLAEIRKSRAVSASELARRVSVSRQTIYAIEAGTYVPNTEVSLHLARELEVTVDELFTLRTGRHTASETVAAEVLSNTPAVQGQSVRICQVGSRWVSNTREPFALLYARGGRRDSEARTGGRAGRVGRVFERRRRNEEAGARGVRPCDELAVPHG